MSSPSTSDKLKRLLKDKAILREGNYTLASQELSDAYIDARTVALDPEGTNLISKIFLEEIYKKGDITGVGCAWSVGGAPIVGAIVYNSHRENKPLRGFIVRKERKAHGTQKIVEGGEINNCKIVMVEDVINTGGSILTAISQIEKEGGEVHGVLCIVDRGQETEKVFGEKGYDFFSIFKFSELV